MARNRQLVWITPVHFDHQGRPIDPDYGVGGGEYPDQGLPGRPPGFWGGERPGFPEHPGNRPPGSWGGEYPGNRPPGSWGGFPGHPDQGLPGGGGEAGQLPVYPIDPEHPDQGLPPEVPPGLPELPPGAVWPPLPPSVPPGKALAVIYISGVGSRWAVIDVPERPEGPEVSPPEGEEHPDQGLPGRPGAPPRPGQGLPRPPAPPRPGQGLPPAPARPGQGLPPTAGPKR
jgi:hypothetical protein